MAVATSSSSSTFYLNALPYSERGAACELPAVRLRDVMSRAEMQPRDRLLYACASNYLYCSDFFRGELSEHLRSSQGGGLLIGHNADRLERIAASLGGGWAAGAPEKLPAFGTMHSKFVLLFYERACRVAVLSNNFLARDFERKTASLWVQDFPLASAAAAAPAMAALAPAPSSASSHISFSRPPSSSSPDEGDFGAALEAYFAALAKDGVSVDVLLKHLRRFSFASARAWLVTSVPGTHGRAHGHLRLRDVLRRDTAAVRGARILCQHSSQGSVRGPFLADFAASCRGGNNASAPKRGREESAGEEEDDAARSWADLELVWPTAGFVRRSTEGWFGGTSCPCDPANQTVEVLALMRSYDAARTDRTHSVPHIKTVSAVAASDVVPGGLEIAWTYTGSHNFSVAAWGAASNKKGESYVRSYELGVALTPARALFGARLEAHLVRSGALVADPRFAGPFARAVVADAAARRGLAAGGSVEDMTVRELKEALDRRGIAWAGMLEKDEFVRALQAARSTSSSSSSSSSSTSTSSSSSSSSSFAPLPHGSALTAAALANVNAVRFFPALVGGAADVVRSGVGGAHANGGRGDLLCLSVPLPFSATPARLSSVERPWHSKGEFPGRDGFGRSLHEAFSIGLSVTGKAEAPAFIDA